ncbi:putative sucrose utilization protein SUC1 [Colletotrichum trifolii]|uniref:Putative sucrose utilization protein SUC1 n=1 Tax=Colletotrichum trifolii TaxID=5466 RepID=A0A4R8RDU8_COLTR|nr:putative sucrose utilization protein SUC1 [Colletotrichum trifolii]
MVSPPAASPDSISPASSSQLGKRHSEDVTDASGGGGGGKTTTSSSSSSRPKRAQVSRACARCKNLRRACSEYRPCKRCVDAGLGDQCLGLPGPVSLAWVSDGSQAFGHVPHEAVQRMADLLPARVMDYCVDRFFTRMHPTIPILTPEYVAHLKVVAGPSEPGMEAHCLLTAVCALVLLQVEEPESLFLRGLIPEKNALHGRMLFEEALAAHRNFARRSNPSFEQCLLTFFLYACHSALFHHSQAFLFLREATTLFLLLRLNTTTPTTTTTTNGGSLRGALADRLFWVLLVSERSHGIRYRRPVTLQITAESPTMDEDPTLSGFWSLASLFSPLDTSFIALLNQEKVATPPSNAALTYIETAVNAALRSQAELKDTQKANLRVTQLWLRIILWQLRLRFGYLAEESVHPSMTYIYPLEVARDLVLSTRDLPVDSIKVHGVGLTEKLFDIASAAVDVLARVPITPSAPRRVGAGPEDDLNYMRRLITRLPGGNSIYDDLLDKHIQQAVPNMALGGPASQFRDTRDGSI